MGFGAKPQRIPLLPRAYAPRVMVVRGKTLIQKTLFLSASHFAVRSVGFLLRLWLSRELGAQTMGLVELAQSAQMLLIIPYKNPVPLQ